MEVKPIQTMSVQNPPTVWDRAETEPMTEPKTRRLSERERVRLALSDTQVDRYIAQERKRATRQQIDQPATLNILISLTVASFLASAVLVAEGTALVAQYMVLPFAWFGYLVFGSVEVAILALMLLYLLIGSRPDEADPTKPGKATRWFVAMSVFVGITIICQVFKTLDGWDYAWTEPRMWVGVLLSTVVPLSYVLISKGLSTAVFARAIFMSPSKRVSK